MLNGSMDTPSVPAPPPPPVAASTRNLIFALPLLTLSWLVLFAVTVMAAVRVDRYVIAPGDAMAVSPRIEFAANTEGGQVPTRYEPANGMYFVTALGGQLSVLDSILGWLDSHVQVDTFKERFGDQTPEQNRQVGFQSMVTSKQIAQYVALLTLGQDVTLTAGVAQVADVVCDGAPETNSACEKLSPGDVIVGVNGNPIPTLDALLAELSQPGYAPGQVVTVSVISDADFDGTIDESKAKDVEIELMSSDDGTRPIIGIIPADTRELVLPFDVRISTTDIGGPSAGLAFTLSLLDELTEGELMGKGRVAATGTIREDGTVGAIGALEQKAIAVKRAGATLFLVPAEQSDTEIERARKAAGPKVKIVPVRDLDDALQALRAHGGDPLPSR